MRNRAKRLLSGMLLASCLLGAAPAHAQLSAREASRALARGVKDAVAEARQRIRDAARDAGAEIQAVTSQVSSGSFALSDLTALDTTLMALHAELVLATASVSTASLTDDLLTDFAGGGMLLGIYPRGFYQGDGGPFDAAHDAIDKEVDKAVSKAERKLRGLAGKLEREAGVGLSFDLRMPFRELEWYLNPPGSAGAMFNELLLSYAFAYSELGAANDGRLCAGGMAPNTVSTLEIELRGGHSNGTLMTTATGQPPLPGWLACFTQLEEGSYLVRVRRQGDVASQWLGIGVR